MPKRNESTPGKKPTTTICLVGPPSNGSSTLFHKYVTGDYKGVLDPSPINDFLLTKQIDQQPVQLQLFDINGRFKFASFFTALEACDGLMICFMLFCSSGSTEGYHLELLKDFFDELDSCPREVKKIPKMMIGCGSDRKDDKRYCEIPKADILAFSKERKIPFRETSAKTGENVDEVFAEMYSLIRPYPAEYTTEFEKGMKTGDLVIHDKSLTNEILDAISVDFFSEEFQKIDFENCGLTALPRFLAYCDPKKLRVVKLQGNPFNSSSASSQIQHLQGARVLIEFAKQIYLEPEKLERFPEVKVMVLGDQAVGKTTLLRRLYRKKLSKSPQQPPVATDGIDLGRMEMGGITFVCWDFAGQEIYKYTHQLFISDNSLCLILFDVTKDQHSSSSHLLFWFENVVLRAPHSTCVLIGTHGGSNPSEGKTHLKYQQKLLESRFPGFIQNTFLVDSLTDFGIKELKSKLLDLAQARLLQVPCLLGTVQMKLRSICAEKKIASVPPLILVDEAVKQLQKGLTISQKDIFQSIFESLHAIGSLLRVTWMGPAPTLTVGGTSEEDDQLFTENEYLMLDPMWLADLMKTIVTVRHAYVRNGLIQQSQITELWKVAGYPTELHGVLLELLSDLDILIKYEGDQYMVPFLLPENRPDHVELSVKGGGIAIRRTYHLSATNFGIHGEEEGDKRERRENFPVGVMGKVLSGCLRWSKSVRFIWRDGCVAVSNEGVSFSVRSERVDGRPALHLIVNHLHMSKEGGTGENQEKPAPPGVVGFEIVVRFFQRMLSLFRNVLEDFYHLEYVEIVPIDDDCSDWCRLSDVMKEVCRDQGSQDPSILEQNQSDSDHRAPVDFVQLNKTKKFVRCDVVCPDLIFSNWLETIPKKRLRLVEGEQGILGKGSYGIVVRGFLSVENCKKNEIKVAVKILNLSGGEEEGANREWEFIQSLRHELFIMSALRHPNLVGLHGVCMMEKREGAGGRLPWLVLELVEGGDLYEQLVDPFSVDTHLQFALGQFEKAYNATLFSGRIGGEKTEDEIKQQQTEAFVKVMKEFQPLQKIGDEMGDQEFNSLLSSVQDYAARRWEKKDGESNKKFQQTLDQLSFRSSVLIDQLSPISTTLRLRIALDVGKGLAVLHSLSPPIIHRDLKSPNVLLTQPLRTITDQEAVENVVAKICDLGMSDYAFIHLQREKEGKGTIGYINPRWVAPEILLGESYSTQSDIYAVGLILWEIRYRKISYGWVKGPFEEKKIQRIVLAGERPPLEFNDEYDSVCARCWAQNPKQRPSASELLRLLRPIVEKDAPLLLPQFSVKEEFESDFLRTSVFQMMGRDGKKERRCDEKSKWELEEKVNLLDTSPKVDPRPRITCSELAANQFVWFGCRNGVLGCFQGSLQKQPSVVYAPHFVIPQPTTLLRCLCFVSSSNTVWCGGDNGFISVWMALPGSSVASAESITFSSEVSFGRAKTTLQLFACQLSWQAQQNFLSSEKQYSLRVDGEVSAEVYQETTLIVTPSDGCKKRAFKLSDSKVAEEWVSKIKQCAWYCQQKEKQTLIKIAERQLCDSATSQPFPVISLSKVNELVWSIDGNWVVTEWVLKSFHAKTQIIEPLRNLNIRLPEKGGISMMPGPILSPFLGEVWITCGSSFVKVLQTMKQTPSTSSSFSPSSSAQAPLKQGQQLTLSDRQFEHFQGEPMDSVVCVNREYGVEVWGCIGNEILIWLPELGGVAEQIPLIDDDGEQRAITFLSVVQSQVWCGRSDGSVTIIDKDSRQIIADISNKVEEQQPHKHIISGIHFSAQQKKVVVSSWDCNLSIWK